MLVIVSILTIAFFWGGDFQKKASQTDGDIALHTEGAPSNEESEDQLTLEAAEANVDEQIENEQLLTLDAVEDDMAAEANISQEPLASPEVSPSPAPDIVQQPPLTEVENQPKQPTSIESGDNDDSATPTIKSTPKSTSSPQESKQDKYLTDPIPSGKPAPVEWQDVEIDKEQELTITLSVSAATILDNLNIFDKDKLEVLPKDGIIYVPKKVVFYEGESVFDVLLREMKANKIHMEFVMTPIYNSNYIEGIHNIYEFDCGELSGWMYKVNEWFPNYGSSRYMLQDGDIVEWVYTCDLGRDVGGYVATAGGAE